MRLIGKFQEPAGTINFNNDLLNKKIVDLKYRKNALDTIAKLREFRFEDGSGLSNQMIAGILGNGTEESGFLADIRSKGGKYNGYWLTGPLIRKYMDDQKYPAGYGADAQHQYLAEWLNSDGKKTRMNGLSYGNMSGAGYRKKDHSTAESSSDAFQDVFENNNGVGRANRRAYSNAWFDYLEANPATLPTIKMDKMDITPLHVEVPVSTNVDKSLISPIQIKRFGGKLIPRTR